MKVIATCKIYVGFNFGSYAYVGVDLIEGLTLKECIKLRSEDIVCWFNADTGEWINI